MTIRAMIVTISDTRTLETDKSGQLIEKYLTDSGHRVIKRDIIKDDISSIKSTLEHAINQPDIDVILTTGGTGIAYRDVTIETVKPLLDKELTGFGEIFRILSYTEDIGSSAIMSRAIAGVAKHKAIFSMPGSSGAVKLAMEKLILPELTHVVHEIKKDL
ncbi:molybdenum cofactor biosynthesis protein B [Cerasibacillus quisquiliarum]|uniref:Molybdenum cofactor biosynthesis protein B n=1 Tax=Cerasibacillus quisquiliarum TaxID=227865 RepID=A0A511V4X5_9BACI|nr:MogA/MoaB family molybdenum cofactor biosynthesis protein [Cerasibacillus quisquiliarum]MBB5147378.1 molybdenum cofactor biosynthesis protein B [Cerasibacillus quisquiliarum]GEN32262.1 molybdenum cofactor biosynthesis protein B [Cerasibacillus quisquiliarum]